MYITIPDNFEALKSLTGKSWKVYRLSPLFKFEWRKRSAADRKSRTLVESGNNDDEAPIGFCHSEQLDPDFLPKLNDFFENRLETSVLRDWMRTFKDTHEDSQWQVKTEVVKGLRGHREDSDAVKISVSLTTLKEKRAKRKKKVVTDHVESERHLLTAFLIGVDSGEMTGLSANLVESTVVLPCCLVNGDTTVTTALLKALEKR